MLQKSQFKTKKYTKIIGFYSCFCSRVCLRGQSKICSIPFASDIIIKEITIKSSLNKTRNPNDPIPEAFLSEQAPDPVEQIEASVSSKSEDVMGSQDLDLASSLEEEELREDRDSLKVKRESPRDLEKHELLVEEEGEDGARGDEEDDAEGVVVLVVGVAVAVEHQVHDGVGGRQENDLHDPVVHRLEVPEDVHVPSREHYRVQYLRLQRHSCTRFFPGYFEEKNDHTG